MDTKIRVKNKWIEVSNQRALVPNVQGETGLVFRPETIKKSVEEYLDLIQVAPYYRVMLDSHVDMPKAKWADIAGLINDVWVDADGAARLNYTIFNNTPVYNRVSVMRAAGLPGFISLSTRGYGKHVTIRPSRVSMKNRSKNIRMLHDSPIKYFKVMGTRKYKKGGVFLEDFILLGWDIVVAPSQRDAATMIFADGRSDTGKVVESGIVRKAFGDRRLLKDELVHDLQMCTGTQCYEPVTEAAATLNMEFSKVVPPLRTYIAVGEEMTEGMHASLGSDISAMLRRWL